MLFFFQFYTTCIYVHVFDMPGNFNHWDHFEIETKPSKPLVEPYWQTMVVLSYLSINLNLD